MTFERSTDYALIREILTDPRAWRQMKPESEAADFEVVPRVGLEFILARADDGAPAAVFVIAGGVEVHFCFAVACWGHSEPIARAFIAWCWANTLYKHLLGPVPHHNRLALRLAKRVGFTEYAATETLTLLEIRKP